MSVVWGILLLLVLWALLGPLFALRLSSRAEKRALEMLQRLQSLEGQGAGAISVERRMQEFSLRLQALEEWLAQANAAPGAAPEAVAAPAEEVASEEPPPTVLAPAEPDSREAGLSSGPWTPSAPTPSTAAAPARLETLEGQIGGRWSVLVGGLALALGAIFLVRYSIEQGLVGPRMRIALGALLAAVLLAGGELLRRRDRKRDIPALAKADVPAVLTGAGALAAFTTIYAAYALYGFLGDAAAFVLLTAAGLITLLLSVIHGPALAALGVLGSYVAPLLVSSPAPKPFPVVVHTLVVTAAVMALARIRRWRWLAVSGIVASLVWGVLIGGIEDASGAAAQLCLLAGLIAVYVAALIAGTEPPTVRDRPPNALALVSLAGVAALSVYFALMNQPAYPPLLSGILVAGALGAIASRWTAAAGAVAIAGALGVFTVMLLPPVASGDFELMRFLDIEWRVLGPEGLRSFAWRAGALGVLIGLGSFRSAERAATPAPVTAGMFAAAGTAAPLGILAVIYLRHVPFETHPGIGIAALALALIFAGMTEGIVTRRPLDAAAPAPAFYATGAVLALAFAIAVGLNTQLIPLALALGAAGIVWVALQRPLEILPWLAVFSAALACVALLLGPPLTPYELGTRPILNGLVHRFGLPAVAVLLAGETLRRRRDGIPAALLQAIGLALAALFVALEIRHLANDGVLAGGPPGLGEQSAYTMAALAFSLGLQRVGNTTGSDVYRQASLLLGLLGAAQIALAHLFTANPVLTGEDVGDGSFFNLLLPGYLLPALLAGWAAAAAERARPPWYVSLISALAAALGFAYVTLTVRHAFHETRLDLGPIQDAENWTYSAVWLAFGIALLAIGVLRRSLTVRAASGVVIAGVVCKVFLFDMAALTGVLRAASFLGLGAALIVIGRLYQRLLMRGLSAPA